MDESVGEGATASAVTPGDFVPFLNDMMENFDIYRSFEDWWEEATFLEPSHPFHGMDSIMKRHFKWELGKAWTGQIARRLDFDIDIWGRAPIHEDIYNEVATYGEMRKLQSRHMSLDVDRNVMKLIPTDLPWGDDFFNIRHAMKYEDQQWRMPPHLDRGLEGSREWNYANQLFYFTASQEEILEEFGRQRSLDLDYWKGEDDVWKKFLCENR